MGVREVIASEEASLEEFKNLVKSKVSKILSLKEQFLKSDLSLSSITDLSSIASLAGVGGIEDLLDMIDFDISSLSMEEIASKVEDVIDDLEEFV